MTTITARFLLNRGRDRLSAEELDALEQAFDAPKTLPPRRTIIERGDEIGVSTFLLEGVMSRHLDDQDGYRQLFGLHIAGDFFDLHALPLRHLDHDVATITECVVATIPRDRGIALLERYPNLAMMMWYATMLDAAMHREWIFRLGRLSAIGRVAQFFCETEARLRATGLGDDDAVPLPINQTDVAEACGLTPVHVNRVLRTLREEGLLTFRSGTVRIEDRARLYRRGEFDDRYLYLDKPAA